MTQKTIEDIPFYTGEYAIDGIKFRSAASAMGITAWGMNVLEFEPNTSGHPTHDHKEDGQEEIYFVVSGEVDLVTDKTVTLTAGTMVRVAPETTRQLVTRERSAVVLAIGGTPGKAYVPSGL